MSFSNDLYPGLKRANINTGGDTLAPALALAKRHRLSGVLAGLGAAALVHAALGTLVLSIVHGSKRPAPTKTVEIQIDSPPPAPKAKPPPAPPPPAPKTAPVAAQPAPAAAQAGKVLTQDPPPDQPVDMTDQGFVSGNGDSFAGGQTAADGTSKTAVGSLAARRAGQRPPPPPRPTAPPPPDLSRPARPTALSWNCGFPPEAEDVDHARVVITVTVGPDGRPESASVNSDPGHGFGRVARRCAMNKSYQPGRDRSGNPTTTHTPPFVVRFDR